MKYNLFILRSYLHLLTTAHKRILMYIEFGLCWLFRIADRDELLRLQLLTISRRTWLYHNTMDQQLGYLLNVITNDISTTSKLQHNRIFILSRGGYDRFAVEYSKYTIVTLLRDLYLEGSISPKLYSSLLCNKYHHYYETVNSVSANHKEPLLKLNELTDVELQKGLALIKIFDHHRQKGL